MKMLTKKRKMEDGEVLKQQVDCLQQQQSLEK